VVTVTEAAEFLHVHRSTLDRMIKRGELPGAFRVGGGWRFKLDELERFTKTNMNESK
jgi:excisionase family DNA binding protein